MSEYHEHFYGGAVLNRLSWLRTSSSFLASAIANPRTKWIVFHSGNPLVSYTTVNDPSSASDNPPKRISSIAFLSTPKVTPLLGPPPYFSQGAQPGSTTPPEPDKPDILHGHGKVLEAARIHGPRIVFLGVEEPAENASLPSSAFHNPEAAEDIKGTPYFALDVSDLEKESVDELLKVEGGADPVEFAEPRGASNLWNHFEAAVFSVARSMIDWNGRNKFCPACGSRVYSLWVGWKLSCSTLLPWANNEGRAPCPSGKGLQNFQHPRTDTVVITAIIDETGDNILLGRNKRFPGGFYSTLAGFLEPSESLEEAVQREIWEESGVRVRNVRYHSCQPWPYPANLMVGCYATADSSQAIRTDLDNELEDARWFTRAEVLQILSNPSGTVLRKRELARLGDAEAGKLTPEQLKALQDQDKSKHIEYPNIRVPGLGAIAGVLISKWAKGEVEYGKDLSGKGEGKARI